MECAVWVQTFVLFVTAGFICWYTIETAGLRREMVRQNGIALRPVVVPVFEVTGGKGVFRLRNIGHGSAFNLRVAPIEVLPAVDADATTPKLEVRFDPLSYLPSGDTRLVRFFACSSGRENLTYGDCTQNFFPGYTHAEKIMKIDFDDVESGRYEQTIRIKPTTLDSNVEVIELQGIRKLTS